jgi:hypothetical protein
MQRILATPKENFSSANLNSKKKRKVCNPEFEKGTSRVYSKT